MEVSAKSNINVEKAFFSLASDIKKKIMDSNQGGAAQQGRQGVPIQQQGAQEGGSKCC